MATTAAYFIEKLPKLVDYLKRPPRADPAKTTNDYLVGSGVALLCAVIWAASYASLGMISPAVGTLTTNVYLMGFAAASLYVASVAVGLFKPSDNRAQPGRRLYGRAVVLVGANLGNFLLSVWALKFISASEAMALTNLAPLFLAFVLWYRGNLTPSLGTFVALILVLLGTFILNIDSGFVLRNGSNVPGTLIAVFAGAAFALWTFTLDEIKSTFGSLVDRLRTLALVFFLSYVVLVTLGYVGGAPPALTGRDYVILALNGVRVACVHLLYLFAVEKAGPLLANVIVVLMVPFTFPFDRIWNGAAITTQLVIGAALIVLAAAGLLSDELRRAQQQ